MLLYNLLPAQFAIQSLALGRLKISRYGELNDPFELFAADLSNRKNRRAISAWKREFHTTKGIICFSERWDNPVLWSHYADRHRGFALGFEVPDQFASIISYSDSRIPLKFIGGDPRKGMDPSCVERLIHTKFRHWEYEQEYRLHVSLKDTQKEGGLFFHPYGSDLDLREVILGHACELPFPDVKKLVKSHYPSVKVIKARLAFKSFRVIADARSL